MRRTMRMRQALEMFGLQGFDFSASAGVAFSRGLSLFRSLSASPKCTFRPRIALAWAAGRWAWFGKGAGKLGHAIAESVPQPSPSSPTVLTTVRSSTSSCYICHFISIRATTAGIYKI